MSATGPKPSRGAPAGNAYARKGKFCRVPWSARLPVETVDKLRQVTAAGYFASQADAVAFAVDRIGKEGMNAG